MSRDTVIPHAASYIRRSGRRARFSGQTVNTLALAAGGERVFKGKRNRWAVERLSDLGYLHTEGGCAYVVTAEGVEAWEKIERLKQAAK